MSTYEPSHEEILQVMETHGGSFVQALALCYRCGDAFNQARLREAFQDLWRHYRELAVLMHDRRGDGC
jgi:hypothetical protein